MKPWAREACLRALRVEARSLAATLGESQNRKWLEPRRTELARPDRNRETGLENITAKQEELGRQLDESGGGGLVSSGRLLDIFWKVGLIGFGG